MNKKKRSILYKNDVFVLILIASVLTSLLAFSISQIVSDPGWSVFDFVLAVLLLSAFSTLTVVLARTFRGPWVRFGIVLTIVVLFALLWAELAVGLFGSPIAGD